MFLFVVGVVVVVVVVGVVEVVVEVVVVVVIFVVVDCVGHFGLCVCFGLSFFLVHFFGVCYSSFSSWVRMLCFGMGHV